MQSTMAILCIDTMPVGEMLPFLSEHISEQQITYLTLLGNKTRAEALAQYGADDEVSEPTISALLADFQRVRLSRYKIEQALHAVLKVLDNQGYEVILLLSHVRFHGLQTTHAMLLEPERLIPPLVASIVGGHQIGVMLPQPEFQAVQEAKWGRLYMSPVYGLANPLTQNDDELVATGRNMMDQGADVLVLDSPCYQRKHRDLLQKALDVPVLLSNSLLARLASEILN
ncbi:AroM family protein [Mangrovibacter yixingensis]|uniref:AroM family protein n=1 Tax=Mangrovibacter yixingensis TaxID=1529639 RepID=UPI001CFA8AF8|nr:AroM family protein [Mangrovibacter yixingensis]